LVQKFSKEKDYKKNSNYTFEILNIFDNRFEKFWKKVSEQFNIIGERTTDFLNWRYKQSPSNDYKIFCIFDDKDDIIGYIVFYFIKGNILHIVDMLYIKSEEIIDLLLSEFMVYARSIKMGAIVIRYLGDNLLEKKFKKFNFLKIRKDETNLVIFETNSTSNSYLLNKENWHFFIGDTDS
jgi:hypothetical protein